MKNDKHPIDDLFQRGLNQHSVPPPMHIWERIEESRGLHHRNKLVFMRQKFTILSSAAAVLLLGVWLGWSENPDLGSFPLVSGKVPVLAEQTAPDIPLEFPATEAGILPDLKAIIDNSKGNKSDTPIAAITESVVSGPIAAANTINIKGIADPQAVVTPETFPEEPEAVMPVVPIKEKIMPLATLGKLDDGVIKDIPTYLNRLEAELLPIPETGCARFSEGRPAIFLAVTAGPSLLNRRFSSKSDEYIDYANQRESMEITQLSYGADARLSIVFPWGGAIRSGIGYTRFNEQMIFRNSKIRQTTITQIYGPDGNVIGADTAYSFRDTVLRYANQHRMIDIPFQLGYEVRYNKVTLAANAGVNINVAYSSKGNYLDPRDLVPARFDNDDPNLDPVYKAKIGLSWQASVGLHYQVNDRLDLMAEPYLRYYPQSFTRDDYPLNQKYLVGGIGMGLRVLL